ncbi:MAG: DUF6249 domain-containing protein [Pseudomonadota bacterium]
MSAEDFIPIVMFLCVIAGFAIYAFYKARWRSEQQTTLRQAIDKDQALTEELVQALTGQGKPAPFRDLRRGLVLLAIAIAMFGFSLFAPDDEANSVFRGLALFPLLVGFAYIVMHKLSLSQE